MLNWAASAVLFAFVVVNTKELCLEMAARFVSSLLSYQLLVRINARLLLDNLEGWSACRSLA